MLPLLISKCDREVTALKLPIKACSSGTVTTVFPPGFLENMELSLGVLGKVVGSDDLE